MSQEVLLIELAADIVSAHVAHNSVSVADVPHLLQEVHAALASLGIEAAEPPERQPAVAVRASIKPAFLVCLECGGKQKLLKRHLQKSHGLSPDEYRSRFGLQPSYPMVAPNYAKLRAELAKQIGLGRMPRPGSPGTGRRGAPRTSVGER